MKLAWEQVAKVNTVLPERSSCKSPGMSRLKGSIPLSIVLSLLHVGPASSPRHHRGAREPMTEPSHLPSDTGSLSDPGQFPQLLIKFVSKSLSFVSSRNLSGFSFQLLTSFPTNVNLAAPPFSHSPASQAGIRPPGSWLVGQQQEPPPHSPGTSHKVPTRIGNPGRTRLPRLLSPC